MINSFTGDYYFLSNFYMAPVSYNGWDYTNNEAAFQAQKTKNRRLRFQLFSKASPSEAKATGRKIDLRSDWEEVKDKVMYEIVLLNSLRIQTLRKSYLLQVMNIWKKEIHGEIQLGELLMVLEKTGLVEFL